MAAVDPVPFGSLFDNALFKASSAGLCTFSNVICERSLGLPYDLRTSTKAN